MSFEAELLDELRRAHSPHTVILYGSRARGDATAESDIDVSMFADVPTTYRDARLWQGVYLDAFVHPTAEADATTEDMLKLVGGSLLRDERGLGKPLLERLTAMEAAGPAPLSADEAQMRRAWMHKMMARIGRGDVEAHYRHHWLLFQILEDDFALHGEWFKGPKRGLVQIQERRPQTHAALVKALAPGGALDALEELVRLVAGERPEAGG